MIEPVALSIVLIICGSFLGLALWVNNNTLKMFVHLAKNLETLAHHLELQRSYLEQEEKCLKLLQESPLGAPVQFRLKASDDMTERQELRRQVNDPGFTVPIKDAKK